jgi:hypothetical protein
MNSIAKQVITSFALCVLLFSFTSYSQTITSKEVGGGNGFNQGKFKNAPKRVYINSFNIYFEVFGSAEASTSGGENFGRVHSATKTAMGVALYGVDIEDFLEIANQAYEYFKKDLISKGFEIVSPDEAGKTSLYSDWTRIKGGALSSAEEKGFVRATPVGFEYFVPGVKKSGKEQNTIFDRSPALSKELNDAIIADVSFTFDFIDMKVFRSELLNISNVKGKVNFKVERMPGTKMDVSKVNFSFGKTLTAATASIQTELKKSIPIVAPVFKDEKFSETTQAQATNIPNWTNYVYVTTDKSMSASHAVTCDGALYKQETSRLLNEFLTIGLSELYSKAKLK